jgi:hypothetical protein
MGADEYETDMVKERRDLPASESVAAVKSKGPSSTRMPGSVTTSSMKWLENYATANPVAYKAFHRPKLHLESDRGRASFALRLCQRAIFAYGSFKALITVAYGHLPLLKIAFFVDDDASAENGILAVQAAKARVLVPSFLLV